MTALPIQLRRGMWIRWQNRSNRIVLEGFVQEIAPDGQRIRTGKTPDSPENAWYALSDVTILKWEDR
jgi:hypothetical protein